MVPECGGLSTLPGLLPGTGPDGGCLVVMGTRGPSQMGGGLWETGAWSKVVVG